MKKLVISVMTIALLSSCGILRNVNWDKEQLQAAAGQALTAASITDAQIVALSQKTVAQLDAQNTIDNGTYARRLGNLMKGIDTVDGLALNFKVYKTQEVNAFACGDGSIRVYTGLMDVMNDDELIAIIGHEIGHVVHQDTKKAMKNAYLASAARGVLNAAGGTIGTLSSTVLGDLGESFVGSQFSQKQEYNADDYGFEFAVSHGYSEYSMYNALNKLVELAGSSQASMVQKMFSSHPDSAARAVKMKEKAQQYGK